jgi:hypothetical protein
MKAQPSQYIQDRMGFINGIIDKAFENFAYRSGILEDSVKTQLVLKNKGINTAKVFFKLDNAKEIIFGNLYTALVYMGYWNSEAQSWSEGTLEAKEDIFTMTNGTKIMVKDGLVCVAPVEPIKYIRLNINISKTGAEFKIADSRTGEKNVN